MKTAIVTGAGGFIGSHFVTYLKRKKYYVIGIDITHPHFSKTQADVFIIADLRNATAATNAISKVDELYMFAANMGGVGYIDSVHADIVRDNSQINVNTIMASSVSGVGTVFFASSACVYPIHKQSTPISKGLKESDAYPAEPDTHYGWEKLFTEQLLQAYEKDYGLNIRIARLHNVYGPEGAYEGGREKSPAALCRKIAMADSGDEIEIWGDGKQTRTYCYIDDCCKGIYMLMRSQCTHPINIGSDQSVTIQQLASSIRMIAKKKVAFRFNTSKPQGVRGRKPDNSLIRKTLGWEPRTPLSQGLKKTYDWIFSQARPRDL